MRRGAGSGRVMRGAVSGAPDQFRQVRAERSGNPVLAPGRATGYAGRGQMNPCVPPAAAAAGRPSGRAAEWGRFNGEA